MLGTFFSFSGRIGRLQYFGGSFALGVAMTVVFAFTAVGLLTGIHGSGGGKGGDFRALGTLALPLMVFGPLFVWSALALQAKRIRDIGWNPAVVIPAWMVVSTIVTTAGFLAAIRGGGGYPAFGGLINLSMSAVLLLWPGNGGDNPFGSYHEIEPLAPSPSPMAMPAPIVPAARMARPTVRPATPPPVTRGPGGFGRRGA